MDQATVEFRDVHGCTACGRFALGNLKWQDTSRCTNPGLYGCVICGDTGEPSPFVNFSAGPKAPAPLADDSYWRNEVARSALRVAKKNAERTTSECYEKLALIKARLFAFRERLFASIAERAQP